MRNHWRGMWAIVFLFLGVSSLPAQESSAVYPQDTVAVLRLAPIDQVSGHLQSFLKNALETKVDLKVEDILLELFDLQNLDGVDRSRQTTFLLLMKSDDASLVAIYPLAEEQAFLAQFADRKTLEDGTFETENLSVATGGTYAVIAEKDDAEPMRRWLKQGGNAAAIAFQAALPEDIQVHVNFEVLAPTLKEALNAAKLGMTAAIQAAPAGQPQNVTGAIQGIQMVSDFSEQVKTLDLSAALTPETLRITKTVHPKESSWLADFARNAKVQEVSAILKGLIPSAAMTALYNVEITDWMMQLSTSMMGPHPEAVDTKDLLQSYKEAVRGSILMMFDVDENASNAMAMHFVQSAVSSEKAQAYLEKSMNWIREISRQPDSLFEMQVKEDGATVQDIPVSAYTMKMKAPDDPEAEPPKNLLETTMSNAVIGELLVITSGSMEDMYKQVTQTGAPDLEWPREEDLNSFFAMRLQPLALLRMAQIQTAKQGGVSPLTFFKIPKTQTPGVTVNMRGQGTDLVGTLAIPASEIRAIEAVVTGQDKNAGPR